jgi:endogenous inhibitor of DNA gyrase (YacG/DUF329 family)
MAGKGPIVRPCPICGADVRGWPSHFEKHNRRYCSYACRAADVRGKKHHLWKPKIPKRCEQCGQEFEVIPYYKDQKYCSQKCSGAAHRKDPVKAKCEGCGKWFTPTPGTAGRFHSMACYQEWRNQPARQ